VKRKISIVLALCLIALVVGGVLVAIAYPSRGRFVVIESYPSTAAVLQALMNGDVDLAPIENAPPETLMELKNNSVLNVNSISDFSFTYIGFNLRESPLNNSVFREAMLYGFDRERSLNEALAGYGELLNSGLFSSAYSTLGWKDEAISSYPYNPEKASALLDSIGFKQSSTGVRIDPSTKQQLRTLYIFSRLSDPENVAAADLFAKDMRSIGLPVISFPETNIDFETQTSVTYLFDMFIDTETAGAAPTWLYDLFTGANNEYPVPFASNLVGYHNATFDECAKQLITASDSDSARNAALRCQEELSLDLPAIPVYSKNLLIVTRRTFPQLVPITGSVTDTIIQTLMSITAGGQVRIGEVSGLSDLNPSTSLASAEMLTLRLITEPLLTFGASGTLEPGLIAQWRIGPNSTTLTLVLREGMRFQGGNPITAHDAAATFEWLINNSIPSTPLYPTLRQIKTVTEVDDHTLAISFRESNGFAAFAIANLFVLPASLLPTSDTPLALLKSGALESSGAYSLVSFVQGQEAVVRYLQPSTSPANTELTIDGVQAQEVGGLPLGGSEVPISSHPLTYQGEPIGNATFTVQIYNGNLGSLATLQGSYLGVGIYSVNLNLNDRFLSSGDYTIKTQLYAQLPSGAIFQFDEETLSIHPPLLLLQILLYLIALAAVIFVTYNALHRKARRVAKRKRRRRGARVRRIRRRK
jgi:ABC-type transport system substrate-binding protein